jgi:glucan biosynthesis protein C
MADIPMGATIGAVAETRSAPRLLFIDNIRWSMIILVLSMHATDTYSPFGNWYFVDRQVTSLATKLFFGVYQSFLQAFFMAVLFFVAGYFSAAAYDRKGFAPFVRDRFFRLGLPTLLYMLVIGPLTQYFCPAPGEPADLLTNGCCIFGTANGCRKPGRCGFARRF